MLSVPAGVVVVLSVLAALGLLQVVGLIVVGVYRLALAAEQRRRIRENQIEWAVRKRIRDVAAGAE